MSDAGAVYASDINRAVSVYSADIYRIALTRLANKSDAEDVMQEVFLRLVRRQPHFASAEHEKAWLLKVAVNCAKTAAARRRRFEPVEECAAGQTDDDYDIISAVASLPEAQRLCVHLFYYQELPVKDIAGILKMPQSTVRSHMHRARAALAEMLGDDFKKEDEKYVGKV